MIMHREVVRAKKVQAIIVSLIVTTIALYIIEITELVLGNGIIENQIIQWLSVLLITTVILREYKRCKFSYKYSIIADKLIINKICTKNDLNLESIKIDDILFVGRKHELPRIMKKVRCRGIYIGDIFSSKKYCCVYKKDEKIIKFIFEPSERLIKTINNKISINNRKAI